MDSEYAHLFKVVLIGDSGVGKSNLMTRYTIDEFNMDSPSTIGVEFMCKSLKVNNRDVKVQIWDTAGQERFRAISRSIYHGAKGTMLVYDITNQQSFDNIPNWLNEVKAHCTPVVILVGNKSDLDHLRVVKKDTAQAFAEEHGMAFLETSALDTTNVDKAFELLVQQIYQVASAPSGGVAASKAFASASESNPVRLGPQAPSKDKKEGCKC